MNSVSVFVFIVAFACVSSKTLVNPFHPSCLSIQKQDPQAVSGLYDIIYHTTVLTVYCEMALHGGGFTFIPRDAIVNGKLKGLVDQLFTQKNEVLLRIQNKGSSVKNENSEQSYTLITQLNEYVPQPLGLRMNDYRDYTKPQNAAKMNDYLLLGILPTGPNIKNTKREGFKSNGKDVRFNNCARTPKTSNSYFAFFPNHREQPISGYHAGNLVYEQQGVAVDWRRTGNQLNSPRQIPNDFFFLTELHFGGCGCYTSSDRWKEAFGTAIGVR